MTPEAIATVRAAQKRIEQMFQQFWEGAISLRELSMVLSIENEKVYCAEDEPVGDAVAW